MEATATCMNMTSHPVPTQTHAQSFHDFRAAVEERMRHHLDTPAEAPHRLMAAAADAVLSSGKRMRPFILHLVCEGQGVARNAVLDAGCALEMVHSASLILDDLPCMDDAAMRRSRPATHVAYGQATAILSSVGLLNHAYGVIGAMAGVSDAQRVALVRAMSEAVGWGGLVAGQEYDVNGFAAADIRSGKCSSAIRRIDQVNRMKTGVLLVASVDMGAILAGFDADRRASLRRFAEDLGQAFQIADDLGDCLKTADEAGKDVGKDAGKATFVGELGPDRALRRCLDLLLRAGHALEQSGIDPAPFQWMIGQVFDSDLLAARMVKQ